MNLRKLRWAILVYAMFDLYIGGHNGGFLPLNVATAAAQTTSLLSQGQIGVSCNAITVATSANPGAAGGCTSLALVTSGGALPGTYTWQVLTTGSPASITVTLQGSLDGITWTQIGTTSSASTNTVSTTNAYRFLGCIPSTLSGGSSPTVTCQISVTSAATGAGVIVDKGGQVFNVKASTYGALGNGSTDDSTAIQAAITAAAAAGTSTQAAQVQFPPSAGVYSICGATQLTLPSNVILVGERGTTIQACSSLPVGKNMIQSAVWSAQVGTATTSTPNLNFGLRGITLDGNTAGRGTMSYFVTIPGTQTATCSMVTTTMTCTPSSGSFSVTGLAAGMLLSVDSCAGYFQVTWTIATVSTGTITATSNPAGTTGLATQTTCLIYNDFQGLNIALHGYQYEMTNVQLINSTNNCAYSEFGHISNVRVASIWNGVDKINCTNIGMVYVGPSDSNFLINHSKQAGFEGNIFKQTLNTATASANSAYGSYLQFTHNSKNGVTGAPGYGDEIDTLIYGVGAEDENQQHSGGIWINCNSSACGNPNFNLVQSWGNTGDGITVTNTLSGAFNPSFAITGCQINGNSVNGINFSSITTGFNDVMVDNCNPFSNTTADIAWPSAATTASNSYVNVTPTTTSGTVPTGLTGTFDPNFGVLGTATVTGVSTNSYIGRVLCQTFAINTITTTGSAQNLYSCTIPASLFTINHTFRGTVQLAHTAGTTTTVTITLLLGATTIKSWTDSSAPPESYAQDFDIGIFGSNNEKAAAKTAIATASGGASPAFVASSGTATINMTETTGVSSNVIVQVSAVSGETIAAREFVLVAF